jgi:hypothetical protein
MLTCTDCSYCIFDDALNETICTAVETLRPEEEGICPKFESEK